MKKTMITLTNLNTACTAALTKMHSIVVVTLAITLFTLTSCQKGQKLSQEQRETLKMGFSMNEGSETNLTPQQILEEKLNVAYENGDFQQVVGIGDSVKAKGFDFMSKEFEGATAIYADALAEVGRLEEAEHLLFAYLEKYPAACYITTELGNLYAGRDNKMAHKYYSLTTKINPYYARGFINNAELYRYEKEYDLATDNYMSALLLFLNAGIYAVTADVSFKILSLPTDLLPLTQKICYIAYGLAQKRLGEEEKFNRFRDALDQDTRNELDSLLKTGKSKYLSAEIRNDR